MDAAENRGGGRRRRKRVLGTLAVAGVLVIAAPWHAAAQLDTPIGEAPVPTTLPKLVVGDGPGPVVDPDGSPPTTAPPTTAPPPVQEQTRVLPGPTTAPQTQPQPTHSPAMSSRRSSSTRSKGSNDDIADTTLVERLAADAPAQPAIARLRRVTVPAARQFGFPLGLAGLVLAFLFVQSRLDARDPKLAAAPVTVDDDLLPFL